MMTPAAVKLQLPLAVGTVRVLNPNAKSRDKTAAADDAVITEEMKKNMDSLRESLNQAVEKINLYGLNLFATHREKIASLAVQIAARVLAKEIEQGHYEMEKILTQAIREVPAGQIVEIRLNPKDLKTCEQYLKNESITSGQEIKLTADASVGQAECVVHTHEGILESRIEEHLRQIEAAMQTAA
jgi:flagellar biosynthesis/type III secretory pathway protein FliH